MEGVERLRVPTLHAGTITAHREQKLYMDEKPSVIWISTSETDRGLEKVGNRKPGTPIGYSPSVNKPS
jgi:hypothetical protein